MNIVLIVLTTCIVILILLRFSSYSLHKSSGEQLVDIQNFLIDSYTPKTHINKINIPMYYINMDMSPDRKDHVERQLTMYNLDATRIPGIVGKDMNLKHGIFEFPDKKIIYHNNYNCSKSELGCLASHLKAIYTAYNNGDQLALILEDDVSFALLPYWPINLMKVMEDAPSDWHVISLFSQWCMNDPVDYVPFSLKNPCYGAIAYIINRKGMYNCLQNVLQNKPLVFNKGDIDSPDSLMADITIYHMARNTYFYTTHVLLFPYNNDDIMDSTIHTNHTNSHIERSVKGLNRYLIKEDGKIRIRTCWPSNTPIPKHFHQIWIGFNGNTIPDAYKKWKTECMTIHPNWEYTLWKDDENRKFLEENYPWFLETFDGYDKPIKRVDAMRYFVLYHYGGVYMDGDYIVLQNLEDLLKDGNAVFGYQYRNIGKSDDVCNAFMACPPKHPLFENLIYALKSHKDNNVINSTGPGFLTKHINKYNGKDITVYPMPIIYSHQWNEKSMMKPECIKDTESCKKLFPYSYGTTDWAGSWK